MSTVKLTWINQVVRFIEVLQSQELCKKDLEETTGLSQGAVLRWIRAFHKSGQIYISSYVYATNGPMALYKWNTTPRFFKDTKKPMSTAEALTYKREVNKSLGRHIKPGGPINGTNL